MHIQAKLSSAAMWWRGGDGRVEKNELKFEILILFYNHRTLKAPTYGAAAHNDVDDDGYSLMSRAYRPHFRNGSSDMKVSCVCRSWLENEHGSSDDVSVAWNENEWW